MSFQYPYVLLALLALPLLATLAVVVSRLRGEKWSAFVAPRLRKRLLLRSHPAARWLAFVFILLALAFFVIALARPQRESGSKTEAVLGRNILIALDLSRSMMVADLQPNRLTQAKATCFELLEKLPNDRIGLVGFAGTSHLFAPLTVDHNAVRQVVNDIETDWIPTGGSNLAGGVEMAIDTLKKSGTRQNALILMSDGEEHIGRIDELANQARAAGVHVIAIGFGTTEGDFVPDASSPDNRFRDRSGKPVVSRLEVRPLERIATLTGGRFAIAASGADIPGMVETATADLDRVQLAGRQSTVITEYFQWFLLPAVLSLMVSVFAATRWRGVQAHAAVAGLLVFLFPRPVEAAWWWEANRALKDGDFKQASKAYGDIANQAPDRARSLRLRLAEGTAAYRSGDWATARHAFSEALRSDQPDIRAAAQHGLGNTLFQIGWARLSEGLPYPETPKPEDEGNGGTPNAFDRLSDAILEPPDPGDQDELHDFEVMVKARLEDWMKERSEPDATSEGSRLFDDLLNDWIDAVKHHDDAGTDDARHNREMTMVYLRKLREILDQVEENAQGVQAVPMPGQGEGDPQDAEGEGEGEGDGQGRGGKTGDEQKSPGDDEENDGGDQGEEESDAGNNGDEEDQQDGEGDKEGDAPKPKPGETPEQAAERILEENADLQKGAPASGRVEFRRPEKDW